MALVSAFFGRQVGHADVLAFDMGGTTAKACLIQGGRPDVAPAMEAARVHRFKRGSGLPIKAPVIDMIEIGAGGGSIAHVDPLGLLKVGPRSAGADPGPACYALGGKEPTVTDANLLLGYLFPRRDFTWIQHWMQCPEDGTYAWGLEFGMQPYDMARTALVALSPMFGEPTFRWLPAKSRLSTRFLMFAARVPPGFDRVTDVRLESGKLVIENWNSRLTLDYAGPW